MKANKSKIDWIEILGFVIIFLIVIFVISLHWLPRAHAAGEWVFPPDTVCATSFEEITLQKNTNIYSELLNNSASSTWLSATMSFGTSSPRWLNWGLECNGAGGALAAQTNDFFLRAHRETSSTADMPQYFFQNVCGSVNPVQVHFWSNVAQTFFYYLNYCYVPRDITSPGNLVPNFTYGEIVLSVFAFLTFTLLFYVFLWYTTTKRKRKAQ